MAATRQDEDGAWSEVWTEGREPYYARTGAHPDSIVIFRPFDETEIRLCLYILVDEVAEAKSAIDCPDDVFGNVGPLRVEDDVPQFFFAVAGL